MWRLTTLQNGLRVITVSIPHAHSVSVGFFIGIGSRYEADEEAGITHFVEHMLFKGTQRRPAPQAIAATMEAHGGVFNASTGQESTTYWAKVARPHLDLALDLLEDMLHHSLFAPAEVEKERRVIIEEINMTLDVPEELVGMISAQLQWLEHPLGRDVAGTRESVVRLNQAQLVEYQRRNYSATNTVLAIAGNVEHDEAIRRLAELASDWEANDLPRPLPAVDAQSEPRLAVHNKATEQTHFILSLPGYHRLHPDRFVLSLLNCILGDGMSSRLFLEVRERLGLAYAVDSFVSYLQDTGAIGVYAGVETAQAPAALQAVGNELARMRNELVTPEELKRAREYTKGRMLLSLEDTLALASWYGRQACLPISSAHRQTDQGPEILEVEDVIAALDAVQPEDIQRVAQDVLRPDKLNLAVVGPFAEKAYTADSQVFEAPLYAIAERLSARN